MHIAFADKATLIYSMEPVVLLTPDSIIETAEQVSAVPQPGQKRFGINDLWKIRQGRRYANGYQRRSL
ncbi:MAG TPA: hypothetical protein PLO99_14640 [Chitinophagaceae bacterium]|nr:hypothetical protein [Chitinophagaceae bacterium]HRG92283.1 hypothetical protein [Chitinophagaceae bacterium]